ncbi:MAG: archease [Deltaproteobacteria bacterium]|nr:archease [Deltaproteobacteria bacterium]
MTYTYLDHEADIGIRAIGSTLEEAFEQGAKAMLNVMWDISTIEERQSVQIECAARDIPELFIEILNEILSKQGIEEIAVARLQIDKITNADGKYRLKGIALGELLNLDKHIVKTEVKAATYAGLKYEQKDNQHMIQCVLDV